MYMKELVDNLAVKRINEHYVAVCEPLQLTLQADTWGELVEDFIDTVEAIEEDSKLNY